MGLPGEAPSPSLCSPLSLSHPSPNLHPLCSLASKFTECFPLTHWIQTKEVPPSLGRSKVSSACFQKGGSPVSLLVFLVPPHCHGAGIGPHVCGWKLLGAVAGKEMESWRWNSAAGLSPYLAVKGFPDPRGQGQPVSLSPSPMSFSSTPTNVPELPWQGWADPCGPN